MNAEEFETWIAERFTGRGARLFRLEQYREYAPTNDYLAWLASGRHDDQVIREEMNRLSRERVHGLRRHRVRIVRRPFSSYLAFQCGVYNFAVHGGEDIRVIDADEREIPDVGDESTYDWILIEDGRGIFHGAALVLDDAGEFVAASEFTGDDLSDLVRARDPLRQGAEAFTDWYARYQAVLA